MASEGFRASYLYFCWTCKQKCLLNIKIQATYWSGDKVQINIGSWKLNEDSPHRMGQEGLTCDECGKTYQRPILARVSSSGHVVKTYQACPHCMTKVHSAAAAPRSEGIKAAILSKESTTMAPGLDGKCVHFFGYLNKRAKGTPVPERCLTCDKMVECLYG